MDVRENYKELQSYMDRAMAVKTAMTLFEWDNETLAPEEAGELTSQVIGTLSGEYFRILSEPRLEELLLACSQETEGLTEAEKANVRELSEELERLCKLPREEYEAFSSLTARAAAIWSRAKKQDDFTLFAPVLKEIVEYEKRFAAYRAKEGQQLYDVLLEDYEKGFSMEELDDFFGLLKRELVPFFQKIRESGTEIDNSFLFGAYPEDKQEQLARFLAEYVGFDFKRGVLAVSAHPFTTNLHNRDVRITTHYTSRVDSSLFSVIHEAGHGIYEMGIDDGLTLTMAGQGASMAVHESQSRFFENMLGRSRSFWVPVYGKLQELFKEQLGDVSLDGFVRAINKVESGLIRTEADELTYSLHVLIRYELEKQLIGEGLSVESLPGLWADKYEAYLGIRPEHASQGVLQDIHWSQGSFGYFPSYALGSAFGAQLYFHMKKEMDLDSLLEQGKLSVICRYLRENIHRYGRLKTSRQLLKDITGEDFNPEYYVDYLKEKYTKLYGLD